LPQAFALRAFGASLDITDTLSSEIRGIQSHT
jgi:hypothetical protein